MPKQQKEDYSDRLASLLRQALEPEKPKAKSKFDWFIFLSAATATAIIAIAYFKNEGVSYACHQKRR